jgi:predicted DNA-binding protein
VRGSLIMAERILKNRKQFTTTLKNELYEAFDKLSQETSIPKSKLMDKAIEMLIKEYRGS